MLSTSQLRRIGVEFIEPDMRKSVLVMPDRKTMSPLQKKGDYLWLTVHHRQTPGHVNLTKENECASSATVYAPGGIDAASASLIDWHEAMGHPHPVSVMFLEQRGLIKITEEKTLDNFNCRICKEAKSTVPHYQRGGRSIKKTGEIVHVDLVGPFIPDMDGHTYLMVFVDEATRFKNVWGLRMAYTP